MKLIELSPHWISLNQWAGTDPFWIGVSFLCPHCIPLNLPEHGPERVRRLAVSFWPPIDPAGLLGRMFEMPSNGGHQRVSGDTFDTLTLFPSIGFENIGHGHWHITNGEIK